MSLCLKALTLKEAGKDQNPTSLLPLLSHCNHKFTALSSVSAKSNGNKGFNEVTGGQCAESDERAEIRELFGRKIAIDASMSIYQFLVRILPFLCVIAYDMHTTECLDGFAVTDNLQIVVGRSGTEMLTNEAGEVTSYVFDGKPPDLKKQELAKRYSKRADATEDLSDALETGNKEDIEKFSKRTVKVTKQHNEDCKKLLKLMGVPVIEAPSEAEAQCAELCKADKVYAVASEDMDSLTFGAPRFLRHLMDPSSKKIPVMEFEVSKVLEELNLTMDQFIDLCILSGCDYCDSIRGIGGQTALKLIRQHGSIENILENINKERYQIPDDWPYQEARRLFKEPSVFADDNQLELKWSPPDEEETTQKTVKESANKKTKAGVGKKKTVGLRGWVCMCSEFDSITQWQSLNHPRSSFVIENMNQPELICENLANPTYGGVAISIVPLCCHNHPLSLFPEKELIFLVLYAVVFYIIVIRRSLHLSHDHYGKLYGLRPGWIAARLNDISDAQWRNFRSNLPILTMVFGIFTLVANVLRTSLSLKAHGMSIIWLLISLTYLLYLHGACVIFVLTIASANFCLVKIFGRTRYFSLLLWIFNLSFLVCNRIYEGYRFSSFGDRWAYLDNFRGTFRWHICFNFVVLRMISFGYDYHWADQYNQFDQKRHIQRCDHCSSGKTCYLILQERRVTNDKFSFPIYLCYLVYAPLYIAGPITSFNAFASQLDSSQNIYLSREVIWYGFRWVFSVFLMELMTHLFYYNAFAISGVWKQLSPMDIFIIGYGSQFHVLKFFLIWRYFRFWSLINGIVPPENMPSLVLSEATITAVSSIRSSCFAIPLEPDQKGLSFVGFLLGVQGAFREFVFRELSAVAGAITITCLMVANLVGFVIGPSGINWLVSGFLQEEGLLTLGGLLITFYVGTKLMFHIADAKQRKDRNFIFPRMVAPSTSSHGLFHGSSIDSFGQTIKSWGTSSIHPLFGTSTPSGSPTGASAFASKISSPFGSTSSGFGGFKGTASNPGTGNECQGSKLASYYETPEVNGTNSGYSVGKIKSISAMPAFRAKSHVELRSEDYNLHKGSTCSIKNQGNAFEQPSSHFCPSTPSVPSSISLVGFGGGLAFGTATAAQVSDSPVKPPIGSTGRDFGVWLSSGTGGSIGHSNGNQAPRNSASRVSSTTIFGAPNNSGIGFNPTPTVFHSPSAHGSTSSIFDVSNVPSFSPGIASSGFSSSMLGFPSTSLFEGVSTSASQVSTTPGVSISIPSFWSTSVSLGSRLSGPQSNCALGAPTTSNFSVSSTSGFLFSSASASASGNSNIFGIQSSSGSQGATTLESIVGNQYRGSRVAPYSATRELGGPNNWYSVEKIQSISAMPRYKDKSHEELRSQDYELDGQTPWCQRSSGSDCLKSSDTPADFLSCPPLPHHPSVNSPCHPFKSNLSAPRSQAFITPNSTIFTVPTLYPHLSPITPTKLYPSLSRSFIAQPTPVASMTTSTPNLKPSSLVPISELMPTNSWQLSTMPTTFPCPSASMFSSSKPSSTVVTALGPWPSVLNPSQPGQAAEETHPPSTYNLSQPSQALNGFTMVTDAGSQNVNGQQYVSSSTGGMQSSLVVNPFATRSATDGSNSVTSVQYGISSIPVSNNPSPDRRTSLVRIRHVSLRRSRLPAKRHTCGHHEPKVPFFSGKEGRPCPATPFLPRENPRDWLVNTLSRQEHAPLHSYAEGKFINGMKPVGQSLNKPAEVTLLNIHCISKKTGKKYIDGPRFKASGNSGFKTSSLYRFSRKDYDQVIVGRISTFAEPNATQLLKLCV
ncbi:UNVERIFIED_CONTAM: Flap endonuclease 1 [Sesamum calycinum]|uniref:Flap endonuclease 1 n=1 Tax=Sesamum calycinum TaxID=2727403 RepID=A0AAW2J4V6_9LAMI